MEEGYTNHPNPSFMKGGDHEMEEGYTNYPNPSFMKGWNHEMEEGYTTTRWRKVSQTNGFKKVVASEKSQVRGPLLS